MTSNLILKIVNRYIGVDGGYLGMPDSNRFTYKSHTEFYPEYCNLNKQPDDLSGTTRARFIQIFEGSNSIEQSKIIKGVIDRFPLGEGPRTRNEALRRDLLEEASRLEKKGIVDDPNLNQQHILDLINDADVLIKNRNASSAVDRFHTALHGYLRDLCDQASIVYSNSDDLVKLIKKLQKDHPKLQVTIKSSEIQNILKNFVSMADSLNPVRNQGSRAHPNKTILEETEAVLVINAIKVIINYIEEKIKN